MEESTILYINPACELEEINDRLLIYDGIHMLVFEEFEKKILSLFDGKMNWDNISDTLKRKYDGYDERELLGFVDSLIQKNILIEA